MVTSSLRELTQATLLPAGQVGRMGRQGRGSSSPELIQHLLKQLTPFLVLSIRRFASFPLVYARWT